MGTPKSIENLAHEKDVKTNLKCLPLSKFVQEDIRGSKEADFGVGRPSSDETSVEVTLAHVLDLLENRLHVFDFCYFVLQL